MHSDFFRVLKSIIKKIRMGLISFFLMNFSWMGILASPYKLRWDFEFPALFLPFDWGFQRAIVLFLLHNLKLFWILSLTICLVYKAKMAGISKYLLLSFRYLVLLFTLVSIMTCFMISNNFKDFFARIAQMMKCILQIFLHVRVLQS